MTARVAVITSEFNLEMTQKLEAGALEVLATHSDIQVLQQRVPGVMELPLAIQWAFEKHKVDAVVSLGVVIQGETDHYDYICQAASKGHIDVGLKFSKPVAFGVLTVGEVQQGWERSGGSKGNKGKEAAQTLLQMLKLRSFSI